MAKRRRTAKQIAASRRNGKKNKGRKKAYRGRYSNKKSVNRAFHTASVVLAGASIGFKVASYRRTKRYQAGRMRAARI